MEITLLATLQVLIKRYCEQNKVTSAKQFAAMARIDRELVTALYTRQEPYCPSWGTVCAIGLAVGLNREQILRDLGPLYDYAYARSARRHTTQHTRVVVEQSMK